MKNNFKEFISKNPELKRKEESLKGFEEILPLLGASRFNPQQKNASTTPNKTGEDFELLGKLEVEVARQNATSHFIFEHLKQLQLFLGETDYQDTLKEQHFAYYQMMVSFLESSDSPLIENLSNLSKRFQGAVSK